MENKNPSMLEMELGLHQTLELSPVAPSGVGSSLPALLRLPISGPLARDSSLSQVTDISCLACSLWSQITLYVYTDRCLPKPDVLSRLKGNQVLVHVEI